MTWVLPFLKGKYYCYHFLVGVGVGKETCLIRRQRLGPAFSTEFADMR